MFSQDQMKFSCDSHKAQKETHNASKVNRNARDKIGISKLIRAGREGKRGSMAWKSKRCEL